jgi:hypothetical protein
METVVGIFDEKYVENALQALYDEGFESDQISLADRDRRIDGPSAAAYRETIVPPNVGAAAPSGPVIPAASVAANGDSLAASGADIDATFLGLTGLGVQKALEFYRHAIDNGATIIVVRTSSARGDLARDLMRRAKASNITESPKDGGRAARV